MKFYDDEYTKKYYNTEKELNEAIAVYKAKEEEKRNIAAEKSANKKALAEAIDAADEALKIAFELEKDAKKRATEVYTEARKKADSIREEGAKNASAILDEARGKVKAAQELKCKAIREFNDKYGTYTKVYSGEDAQKEYERLVESIESFEPFKRLLSMFW